jgi:hypothetical protein
MAGSKEEESSSQEEVSAEESADTKSEKEKEKEQPKKSRSRDRGRPVDVIMMAAPMASAVVVRDDTARIVTVIAAAWLLQFLSRRILPNTPTVLTR